MTGRALVLTVAAIAAFAGGPAAGDPIPYEALTERPFLPVLAETPGWREAAEFYLATATSQPANPCVRLKNYWCVAQTFADPWVGSVGSDGQHAAFSDARWSARAAALDVRERYRAGNVTARALAATVAPPCANPAQEPSAHTVGERIVVILPMDCRPITPEALAAGTGRGPDDDLGLFDAVGDPTPALRAVLINLAAAVTGAAPRDGLVDLAVEAVSWNSISQDAAGFAAWRASRPERAAAVERFERYLESQGVRDVLPTYQILRTGSDWRGCGGPFVVPPDSTWPNVVEPLRLIRDRIKPEFPQVEAMSGYRDAWQNICMGGAENSAHRQFLALDLVPNAPIERFPLMRRLCVVYNGEGEARNMGLGFYKGVRFHVDTWKHRTWANVDGQPLNVCVEEAPAPVNAAPIPYNSLGENIAISATSH